MFPLGRMAPAWAHEPIIWSKFIMTSSNGNIFRVTDHLCGEFTGSRWIPRTKASDAELWCFVWSGPEKNSWVNNCEAGDLRRYLAHCDVIVMYQDSVQIKNPRFIHMWMNQSHSTEVIVSNVDYSVYAPSQWGTALQCNTISHWLGLYTYNHKPYVYKPCLKPLW